MFGNKNKQLKKRYRELAGMLKEVGKGTIKQLEEIKTKFCIQEGVKALRVEEYLDLFEGAGLLEYIQGNKGWVYKEENEWNMFKIKVNNIGETNRE